jgi:ectoine hydroxylase-related dioxygenase (phytanoyl-CoA dioxygenase family)
MATLSVDYGPEEKAMQAYIREGEARAMEIGNRGPLRLTDDGKLHPDIIADYNRVGFYVLEDVLDTAEVQELIVDFHEMYERLPVSPNAKVDRHGGPALGADQDLRIVMWSKPLGDPMNGTKQANGRHVIKMFEPEAAKGLPDQVPYLIVATNQYSDASLRLNGHPDLLTIAETLYGPDFCPYTDAIIFKKPGEGASVSWHQDGTVHWGKPDWDQSTHGVNLMAQIYGSTAANGVWFMPGTHATGRADIKKLVAEAGSDRLPGAVPLIAKPGDVAISNRQTLHGSFANTSPNWRVTFNLGFHRRSSVLGATGYNPIDNSPEFFDEARIRKRSEMIGYAIDARHQHFPNERRYVYQPHQQSGEVYRWDEAARDAIHGYNRNDMII